uniref:Secreted protein n=1 Tax=Parascaris equorum TaxID=6256 RepID=A0A914RXF4_PAREQ
MDLSGMFGRLRGWRNGHGWLRCMRQLVPLLLAAFLHRIRLTSLSRFVTANEELSIGGSCVGLLVAPPVDVPWYCQSCAKKNAKRSSSSSKGAPLGKKPRK